MDIILLVGFVVVLLVIWNIRPQTTVIFEYERGVLYTSGKFKGILQPGIHRYFRQFSTIHKLDMRPRFISVIGQELLSSDHIGVKISLAAKFQIADPYRAINSVENYQEALYLELQLALRQIVGSLKIDDLLEQRQEVGAQLLELARPNIEPLGLQVLSVSIKDLMFPGELKKIFAQVIKAQKEGLAALEKARGESAALRNLANAARMIENNPALLQLRLLQAIGETSGSTVVFGLDGQIMIPPNRLRSAPEPDQGTPPSSEDSPNE
jgi:regulator of protease activity HflC (stomatin/prohibitin superfamily)